MSRATPGLLAEVLRGDPDAAFAWRADGGTASSVTQNCREVGRTPVLGHGQPVGAVRALGSMP